MPTKQKKVLILYVGGTIGMQKNSDGAYIPIPNEFLRKLQSEIQDVADINCFGRDKLVVRERNTVIICDFKEYDPLLDSSNMSTADWTKVGSDIKDNYYKFDGFVVLHGTDTMCYTASALSFMFEGLTKPIILTGSQISIFETRSDAKSNILSSIIIAADYPIPEVSIFFGDKLLRGNRSTKISSTKMNAFGTPNYHVLCDVGVTENVYHQYIMKPRGDFKASTRLNSNVGVITVVPTITPEILKSTLRPPLEGVVLESFGVGNIPTHKNILSILQDAVDRGLLIVNISQCRNGTVTSCYEPGMLLENIGVIPGYDMTLEAALTKLSYVLTLDLTHQERIQLMKTDMRGELTNMESNNNCNNNNNF